MNTQHKVTIIAECGINHGGDMQLLKRMIVLAQSCGCDIIKTQLYDPAKLFPQKEVWVNGVNWYPEVEKTKLSKEQFFQFVEWCKEVKAEPMASCFDLERFAWLEEADIKRHKVASRSISDRELIEAIDRTGKEVLVSLPYGNIILAPLFKEAKARLLYCIPEYPTDPHNIDWKRLSMLQGFSDHSVGIEASLIAVARGATIIEKHVTLDKQMQGPDHKCSANFIDMAYLISYIRKFEEILYATN